MKTKVCTKCKIELPLTEFSIQSKCKKGHASQCKKCYHIRYIVDKAKHPDKFKLKARKSNKKSKGLPLPQFNEMVKAQKELCKICGLPEIEKSQYGKTKALTIDHNHVTKKVRGLLCSKCNRALGLLDVDRFGTLNLQMAINYLTEVTRG